jgi:hypothetical protein
MRRESWLVDECEARMSARVHRAARDYDCDLGEELREEGRKRKEGRSKLCASE